MTEENYALRPDGPAFLAQWMASYRVGEDAYRLASRRLPGAKGELAEARVALDRIESDIAANGGTPAVSIDGKNDAARKAQLATALEGHTPYVEARQAVRAAERAVENANGEINEGEHAMRAARLALEWGTSVNAVTAAAEGGRVQKGV